MSLDLTNSSLAAVFALDSDKAENGNWFPITSEISVKLRRFKSRSSQDARTEFMKPYTTMMRRGQELPEALAIEVLNKQLAKGVIVDWRGVKIGEQDVPCTFDNKFSLLQALPEFRDAVFQASVDMESFKPDAEEGIKN